MWHLRKWKAAGSVHVHPFDDPRADSAVAIEVYPALAKLGSEERGRAVPVLDRHLRDVRLNTDEYDAALCALMGVAYAIRGSLPQIVPRMVAPPSHVDTAILRAEGWIYYPDPEWLRLKA
jgi:hypothetical protein